MLSSGVFLSGSTASACQNAGSLHGVGLGSTQASLAGRSSLASRPAAAAIGGPAACGVGVMNNLFRKKTKNTNSTFHMLSEYFLEVVHPVDFK